MKRFTILLILLLALSVAGDYATNITVIEESVIETNDSGVSESLISLTEALSDNLTEAVPAETIPDNITEEPAPTEVPFAPSEPEITVEENLTVIEQVDQPAAAPDLEDALDTLTDQLSEENTTPDVVYVAQENGTFELVPFGPTEEPIIEQNITTASETNASFGPIQNDTVEETIVIHYGDNLTIVETIEVPASAPYPEDALDALVEQLGNESVEAQIVTEGTTVTVDFDEGPIKEITLLKVENATELPRVESVPTNIPVPIEGMFWAQIYAIDPTNTTFEKGIVEVVAKGETLYKCKEWNFDARVCEGDWALAAEDMVPGNTYYLEIDAADPAFGEISASDAVHLDENYALVSNIYGDVSAIDDDWSEPIPDSHFVRVTFEEDLESGNVIDLLARDNGTVSYVEVYVANTSILVGRSGIANPTELQYITLENVPYPTDAFDLKVVKHYHNVSEEICDDMNPDCADGSIADNAKAGFMEFDFIHDEAILPTGANGLVAYEEAAVNAPRYRLWNKTSASFGAELTASVNPGGLADWIVARASHMRDEFFMGVLDAITNTSVQRWNGTNWTDFQALAFDNPATAQRGFDLAIEDVSGDMLIVYENSTAANTVVAFRTWTGSAYSAEGTATVNTSAAVRWVKTVPRPRTDEIMLLVHDSNNDLFGILWNGTGFVSSTLRNITGTLTVTTGQVFDFEWEGLSGDGIVVYGNNTAAPGVYAFRTFNATSRTWSADGAFFTLNGGVPDGMRICSDPTSDYVGFVSHDSTNDVNFRVWNGTGVETSPAPPAEEIDGEPTGVGAIDVDCAFERQSGRAIFTYVPNTAAVDDIIRFCTYNKTAWSSATIAGCSNGADMSVSGGSLETTELYQNPVTNEIMSIALNIDEDLAVARWNTTNFTNVTEPETALDCLNGQTQCAMFDWDRFDPAPNISIIAPVNNTNFTMNSSVNITANAADNINVSRVVANVTQPNSQIVQLNLTLFQGSNESGNWSVGFSNTSSTGQFNFTVCAQDSSTHNNWKCLSGFFRVPGPTIVSDAFVMPTDPSVETYVCLGVNVTDADGVSNVIATIDLPIGPDGFVTLLDTNTCNSVPGDGVFSNLYELTTDGTHNWTSINSTDMLSNIATIAIGLTFDGEFTFPNTTGKYYPSLGAFDDFSFLNISLINVSDGIYAAQSATLLADTFTYFNWTLNLTGSINDSNVTIEHHYTGILAPTLRLQVKNGSVWQDVCSLSSTTTDSVNTCDLDPFVQGNVSFINALQLRTNISGISVATTHSIDEIFITATNVSAPDVISPIISFVSADETNISANITWLTDEFANSTVNYGTTLGLGTIVNDAGFVVFRGIELLGLTNGTTYFYNVTSCDPAGNCATSGTFNFTTKTATRIVIRNASNGLVNATIEIFKLNGTLEASIFTNATAQISPGLKNVRVVPASGRVIEVNLTNVSMPGGLIDVGSDDTEETLVAVPAISRKAWEEVFALDPTALNFVGGTVTANASGRRLVKCANWNFTSMFCPNDNWTFVMVITPGQLYTFNISSSDPGFGEINATAAEHLDENYTFIADIFPEVNESDGVFSEKIPETHYVRVTFAANLTNGSFIDIVARDNGTVAFVEVYLANTTILVGRSGIANPVEPQFIILEDMPNESEVFDLRVVKFVHNVSLAEDCGGNETCNASSNAENNLTALLEFDFIHDEAVLATGTNGLVAYEEAAVNAPRYRLWNRTSTNFSLEFTNSVNPGGLADWIVVRANHMRDEFFMGILDASTNTSIQRFNGTNWTDFQALAFDNPNTAQRGFDVAIEDVSGDMLVVYENSTGANSVVAFRTWNGSAYSSEGTITLNATAAVNWIRAIPRPGTDEIMVVAEDTSSDLFGILWNGTGFVSSTLQNITGTMTTTVNQAFDFKWMSQSSDGLVVYATNVNSFNFRAFNATSLTWSANSTFFTLDSGTPKEMRLCSDPTSDYVGFTSHDSTNDINFRVWNGTGVETSPAPPTEDTDGEPTGAGAIIVDCAFETQSGIARFGYVPNPAASDDSVRVCTYTKTAWSNATIAACPNGPDLSTSGGSTETFEFRTNPVTNEIMVIGFNVDEDLESSRWNGSAWVNNTVLETTLDCLNGATQCGMFDWDRFDPPPNITITTPVNNTNFTAGQQVNITVNATDNVNVSRVLANVTQPNSQIVPLSLSLFQGTNASGNWSVNFTNATMNGQYNFTACAIDSSTHMSTNCTSGFFNVSGGLNDTNVTVIKIDIPDPVVAGATLLYQINISNTGNDTALGVTLFDIYPVNVTFNGSQPASSSGNNTFSIGSLSGGSSFVVNITVNVSSATGNGTVLNNTAVVNYTNGSGSQTTNTSILTTVLGFPRILTNKTDFPDPVGPGDQLLYQILVANLGTEIAYNVTVNETYPPVFTTFHNSSPSPTSGNNVFSLGNLSPGISTTLNITVNVSAVTPNGTVLNNTYNITFANASGANLTVNNNSITTTVDVFILTKTDAPDPVMRGQLLNYTITFNNTGNLTAFNVTVVDTYPPNVSFVTSSPAPNVSNNTWFLGDVASGIVRTVNITVNVSSILPNGTILNNSVN
ncbi:MAG: Ig-like domain-containing protein, partial [Anaerolineae bacterium]|nr:Ig-like domain-containing protein [Anaerolineae bacterium]